MDAVDARRGGQSEPSDRGVRRQRREAARREVQPGPRAGGPPLAAGHDRDPRRRLRRARRRGHPAAARPLGRDGDDGPARDPEPGLARGREHQRDRAPDRAGGRRRLLDVLLEARARRARGGQERERGSRGCRRHLGTLRPDLRPDGDDRDGRHVPDGRQDVRLVRDGDHPRRGDRRARLAHRPAGAPLVARRPRQQGARALPPPLPAAGGRQGLGLDPRPGPRPPARLRGRCDGGSRRPRPPRARDEDGRAGRRGASAGPPRRADVQPAPGRLPRRAGSGDRRREGTVDRQPAGEGGDRRPPAAGARRRAVPSARRP